MDVLFAPGTSGIISTKYLAAIHANTINADVHPDEQIS